ncbi:hypothetical protein Vi05172_g2389 [Venturia inaequalis]|nr:hypothetical protein Vi05172_g2389 [Venturia inaequalis]
MKNYLVVLLTSLTLATACGNAGETCLAGGQGPSLTPSTCCEEKGLRCILNQNNLQWRCKDKGF